MDVVRLAHALVTPPGVDTPEAWIVFLHGILGSGANWRTFAKQVVGEVGTPPRFGAVLVDLRLHGESQGLPPPHTVRAAAEDVDALAASLPGPVKAVLAHSFGGKVALDWLRIREERSEPRLERAFVIDATPGVRLDARGSESTKHIVELLRDLPSSFADRNAFTQWIEARGVSRPVAMWLAMNVRPAPNTREFVFRIDLAGIRSLLDDYFRLDLWDAFAIGVPIHLIVGGASSVVDEGDRARARAMPNVTVDVVEGAGHWVHAEAPDALRRLVVGYLTKG